MRNGLISSVCNQMPAVKMSAKLLRHHTNAFLIIKSMILHNFLSLAVGSSQVVCSKQSQSLYYKSLIMIYIHSSLSLKAS